MLTKLTKTILAHDQDLKVTYAVKNCLLKSDCVTENLGEPDADGQGRIDLVDLYVRTDHEIDGRTRGLGWGYRLSGE